MYISPSGRKYTIGVGSLKILLWNYNVLQNVGTIAICGLDFFFVFLAALLTCFLSDLMQPADIYLIDEPSAYLDSEQRIVASKVIKRFILHAKKTAFVVEHDFIMATYLADRVIVYEGQPSVDCTANTPQSLLTGMNLFLSVSKQFSSLVK